MATPVDKENQTDKKVEEMMDKNPTILLVGAPNVGKSVLFSQMTNTHVISSNYSGTTVNYTKGDYYIGEDRHVLVDVPGTYSLAAANEAERIAVGFLENRPELILFTLHAADLEGSLKLLLEVLQKDIPVVCALNLVDVAKRQGREVDIEFLERELCVPIVPTVAVRGEGISELERIISESLGKTNEKQLKVDETLSRSELWKKAKELKEKAVSYKDERLSKADKFGAALLKPFPGIFLAVLIMLGTIGVVVGGGKALRAVLLLPLVNDVIVPFFEFIILPLGLPTVVENVLIGEFGFFRIAFEWIIALIMPYVIIFQFVFTFLEDSGILPRLAVLGDNLMSKIGIQGGSIINVMLGFGCTVPAIIGTRTASTRKERLVVTTALCFAIPCVSQTGALISLLGDYSYWLLLALFLTGLLMFIISSKISSVILPGKVTPMVMEVPYLLVPERKAFLKKFKIRVKSFFLEAEGPMLIAVAIAALFTETGLLDKVSVYLEPIVSGWLGLPPEASLSLLLGIIRREMSVAPLLSMDLTGLQMFVGAVVSLLYIPCLSVMGIIAKEFNAKTAVAILVLTTISAIAVAGLISQVFGLVLAVV